MSSWEIKHVDEGCKIIDERQGCKVVRSADGSTVNLVNGSINGTSADVGTEGALHWTKGPSWFLPFFVAD